MEDVSLKETETMIFLYIWFTLIGIIFLMGIIETIMKAVGQHPGATHDWSGYNTAIFTLCMIAFFPVMLLVSCVKKSK